MGSYYYLAAQLPYLIYEQKPPMSSEYFKDLAGRHISKSDNDLFKYLTFEFDNTDKTGCGFIDGYRDWELSLRQNLAVQRTIKSKRDISIKEPSFNIGAAAAALKAIDEKSPLDAEFLLDKARWNAIEELAGSDNFSRNYIYAYFLKLLLIERRESFNEEKGFSEYKLLYASILDKYNDMISVQESQGEHK
ncbi:MAG: DUF2764 domain-containing protein [Treponema sp.]|nr:DUF2764 domain-containing protein [Treponema sp.]